jgi:arylsulfatase A-like enzyme
VSNTLAQSPRSVGRLLPWALVASAVPAAWPFFRLPAWSMRARFLVGGVIGVNLILVTAGALIFAVALALRPRVGRLALPLGAVVAVGLSLAVRATSLEMSEPFQIAGRLLGCGTLLLGAFLPGLRRPAVFRSGVAGAAVAVIAAAILSPPVRPDLVLIVVDTLRADRVPERDDTRLAPHIGALGRSGVRFTRCWSTAPWTVASESSIFTGIHPSGHGAQFCRDEEAAASVSRWWHSQQGREHAFPLFSTMATGVETLGEALSRGGYATGGFSSSFRVSAATGFARGFDVYQVEGDRDVAVASLATGWLRKSRAARLAPLVLFVHFLGPHQPYEAPPVYLRPGYHYEGPLPAHRFVTFEETLDGELLSQRVMRRQEPLAPRDLEHISELYDAEVRFADRNVGSLLAELDGTGSGPRSLVVLTSDHGEFLGEKSLLDHSHFMYEEALRVPLVARFPAEWRLAGRRCDAPVSSHDIYPTLLDAAGVVPRHPLTSEDLRRRIEAPAPEPRRLVAENAENGAMVSLFGERFAHSFESVIDGRWKLIRTDRNRNELYDLEADPAESRNLADRESRKLAELTRALEDFRRHEIRYPPAGRPSFTPEEIRQLRALGYLR